MFCYTSSDSSQYLANGSRKIINLYRLDTNSVAKNRLITSLTNYKRSKIMVTVNWD